MLAIISICCENIVITKITVGILEHDDIAKQGEH